MQLFIYMLEFPTWLIYQSDDDMMIQQKLLYINAFDEKESAGRKQ